MTYLPNRIADGDDIAEGATADAAVVTDVAGTVSGKLRGLVKHAYERMPTSLGQKAMAASLPVVVASDQSNLPIKGPVAVDGATNLVPVEVGGRASYPAIPGAMSADNDVNDLWLDRSGAQIVRKRPVPMYTAAYRLADATAAARFLSTGALTANTDKQLATIYHPNTATKRVAIKYVVASITVLTTVAGTVELEIQPLNLTTAPATGNPAIVPGKHDQVDGAAEATCLALPTTAGSYTALNSPVGYPFVEQIGITGAAPVVNPVAPAHIAELWDSRADGDGKDLIMRSGVAEGFAVIVRSNAASVIVGVVTIVFTEE